jgi:glycosyltransferase involved in cell wall biosynthesis
LVVYRWKKIRLRLPNVLLFFVKAANKRNGQIEKIPQPDFVYDIRHANGSREVFKNDAMDFCVLIPYYNDFEGLIYSVKSIVYQATKFSVVIVDDGSEVLLDRDALIARIQSDFSFEIISLPENQGITKALNAGLTWINNRRDVRYVARLDCGDWCYPDRFIEQVNFLNTHDDVHLLGSWCVFQDDTGKIIYKYRTPISEEAIQREMHFRNVFIHPTVMWRNGSVSSYPENFPYAEDYGLFYSLMKNGAVAILPRILVRCRLSVSGLSSQNRRMQLASRAKVVKKMAGNKILMTLGILKIYMLKIFPYDFILQIKRRVYPL